MGVGLARAASKPLDVDDLLRVDECSMEKSRTRPRRATRRDDETMREEAALDETGRGDAPLAASAVDVIEPLVRETSLPAISLREVADAMTRARRVDVAGVIGSAAAFAVAECVRATRRTALVSHSFSCDTSHFDDAILIPRRCEAVVPRKQSSEHRTEMAAPGKPDSRQ